MEKTKILYTECGDYEITAEVEISRGTEGDGYMSRDCYDVEEVELKAVVELRNGWDLLPRLNTNVREKLENWVAEQSEPEWDYKADLENIRDQEAERKMDAFESRRKV